MLKGIFSVVLFAAAVILAPWQAADPEPGLALTAMSYNIRYGTANDGDNAWPNRREICIQVIRDRDADLIGLQEALAFQLDEISQQLADYAIVGVGRDDGKMNGEFAPLLIRRSRFLIDQSGTTWFSDTPERPGSASWGNRIPRICTWTRVIDRTSGQALWVYNLHLDHQSQASRERSVEFISALIASRPDATEPVIVLGDLNAGEDNTAVRYLRGLTDTATGIEGAPPAPNLIDAFRRIHPQAEEIGTFNGFSDTREGAKIDHLFVSSNLGVRDAGIDRTRGPDNRCPSDHDAVWALVEFVRTERE